MCRRNLDISDLEVLKKPLWNNVLTTVFLSERLATEWTSLLVHTVQRLASAADVRGRPEAFVRPAVRLESYLDRIIELPMNEGDQRQDVERILL